MTDFPLESRRQLVVSCQCIQGNAVTGFHIGKSGHVAAIHKDNPVSRFASRKQEFLDIAQDKRFKGRFFHVGNEGSLVDEIQWRVAPCLHLAIRERHVTHPGCRFLFQNAHPGIRVTACVRRLVIMHQSPDQCTFRVIHHAASLSVIQLYPFFSSSSASVLSPERMMRPSARTWTKSGSM